jgi:pyruvate/2-oxoglutarate/acetoin dehydrogenase E1 component
MREWILEQRIASSKELDKLEDDEKQLVRNARETAWHAFRNPIEEERRAVLSMMDGFARVSAKPDDITAISQPLSAMDMPLRRHIMAAVTKALLAAKDEPSGSTSALRQWRREYDEINRRRYDSHLYSESVESALKVPAVPARYSPNAPIMRGFEIIKACFDAAFERIPHAIAIGEDVGRLGGVNQGWAHLQEKFGPLRVTDTGIREATIIGQAIGMALRGLRPIAEIQYLDYFLYALQIVSDDLASLRWRTHGGQKAPVIISTRGHRLEGIWHSGSPMSGILNLVRGLYVCVPRNSVKAAGFYNTMLRSDDAALIVEVLNGYRKKERLPDNIGEYTLPLGVTETLREGCDVTLVTYGACCEIAMEAAVVLETAGISMEIIDVQTLLPFDLRATIRNSIRKTSRVLFLDEDCPGGATAYMMQEVLERQAAWDLLDAPPRTLSAKPHRPAYGSDGDYFSKPNREQIIETVYSMMRDCDPRRFPPVF